MPTVKINPIIASSTPGGFIRAARELETDADWRGGVTFTGNCGGAHRWQCDYSGAEKTVDPLGDPVEFVSFLLYAGVSCSGAPVVADLRQHAQIKLTRGRSGQLAQELHTSAVGNPDLSSDGADITPGTNPCVDAAIAGLLTTAADCGGGELTFHVPFVALPALMKSTLVVFEDGRYRLGGHTIIVDEYPNTGPAGAPAGANQAWIWATGPVEYKLDDQIEIAHFQHTQNDSVLLAEQLAVLRFDPCCVYAILADIC